MAVKSLNNMEGYDVMKKAFTSQDNHQSYLVKRKVSAGIIKIIRTLFFIGLVYLFLFPLIYLFVTAFQSADSINNPNVVWIPEALTMDSMKTALKVLDYQKSVSLSIVISVFSTLAALFSCSLVGYGFARYNFAEKKIAFSLVVLTIIVPPPAIVLSTYVNFRFFDFGGILKLLSPIIGIDHINLIGSSFTFILPSLFACGLRSGLFIFIFRQFFLGMSSELEEAARIDGCGPFKTYFRIIVPLAVPVFITVMLFSFIWHWNDVFTSSMYFLGTDQPISVKLSGIYDTLGKADIFSYGTMTQSEMRTYAAAGCLLTILPPLIIYIFTQKYFTESIERSGIVG